MMGAFSSIAEILPEVLKEIARRGKLRCRRESEAMRRNYDCSGFAGSTNRRPFSRA